jgi:rfaE bifunctional protein nucleotidyltransferase chain/domain
MKNVLTSEPELLKIVELERNLGKTIVTTNGTFDILHRGHISILETAKSQGDILIVGLNGDKSVKAYKGPDRPINPEYERAEILIALEPVDYVYIFQEPECIHFVELVKPDVHVNDSSYGQNCIERPVVEAGGGRLFLLDKIKTLSTTDIIEKIKNLP